MARKFEIASGRISLRLPPELHEWLGKTADKLGYDVNRLIVELIRAGAPTFDQLADAVEQAKAQVMAKFAHKRAEDAIQQAEALARIPVSSSKVLTGVHLLLRLIQARLDAMTHEGSDALRERLAVIEPSLDPGTADRLINSVKAFMEQRDPGSFSGAVPDSVPEAVWTEDPLSTDQGSANSRNATPSEALSRMERRKRRRVRLENSAEDARPERTTAVPPSSSPKVPSNLRENETCN